MVINQGGIAATSQVLASQVGAQILARGGTAVDAAIAANVVLTVTEPLMTSIGGDLWVMYWDAKTGKLTGLNSSGPAPKALTPEFLAKQGIKRMPQEGINSVTVPGAVRGWYEIHQRFGKLPWRELFQPAIYFAEQGYPVHEGIAEIWDSAGVIRESQEQRRIGARVSAGRPGAQDGPDFRDPDLGRALRLIADQGPDAFLQRRHRQGHSQDVAAPGRDHDGRGPGGVFARVGGAVFDRLSRLARL